MNNLLISSLPYDQVLTITSIHATILSIFLGILAAYMVYSLGKTEEMLGEAIADASKVNDLRPVGWSIWLYHQEEPHEIQSVEQAMDLLLKVESLAVGVPGDGLPTDQKSRGRELLRIFCSVSRHYPFPSGSEYKVNPLTFDGEDSLREWLKAIKEVVFISTWDLENHPAAIKECVDDYLEDWKPPMVNPNEIDIEAWEKAFSPGFIHDELLKYMKYRAPMLDTINNFKQNIEKAREISDSVERKLILLDMFRNRVPKKLALILILILSLFVFFLSVIYPILFQQTPVLFLQIIPSVFYLGVFLLIVAWITKTY